MKNCNLIFGVSFLLVNCNPKLSPVESIEFSEGLHFGYKSGVLSSSQFYVFIKKDTTYTQCFQQMNGVVEMLYADTLLYQNDSLYTGKLTSLTRENKIYLVNQEGKLRWKLKVKLSKADNRVKNKWDSNNNSIHFAAITVKYSELYQKLPEGVSKKDLYNAHHILARKIYELDQNAFFVELSKFENEFLAKK